jgi:hypothetical protein
MNHLAQRSMRQPWFSAVLLIALLSRALVPVGYMPGIGSDGAFTVMLCPGYAPLPAQESRIDSADSSTMADMPGMATMPDMAGPGGHSQHENRSECPCPYAGATTGMALVQLAPATLLAQQSSSSMVFPPARYIPRGTIVPTRLPRGPPLEV